MGSCSIRPKARMRSNRSGRREQMYTTAEQTRTTVISAIQPCSADGKSSKFPLSALCHSLDDLAEMWRQETLMGMCKAWVNAANTGIGVILGYQAATINVTPQYPLYEQLSSQEANESLQPRPQRAIWAMALLKATCRRWERCEQTPKRENQTFGSLRLRHTRTTRHNIRTWPLCSGSTKQHLCSSGPSRTQTRLPRPQLCNRWSRKSSSKMHSRLHSQDAAEISTTIQLDCRASHIGIRQHHEPAALRMSIGRGQSDELTRLDQSGHRQFDAI